MSIVMRTYIPYNSEEEQYKDTFFMVAKQN